MTTQFLILRRAEGAAFAIVAALAYAQLDASWWLFVALFLLPDVFMVGYLKGNRVGAWIYNVGHTYLSAAALGAIAFALDWQNGVAVALIWTAHIGFDRALGYGLKHVSGFRDTHLSPAL